MKIDPRDLREPILREDIDDLIEMALDRWKVSYRNYRVLEAQGAPPALLNEFAWINYHCEQAYHRLVEVREWFPEVERTHGG
jgi:hypothetical protein